MTRGFVGSLISLILIASTLAGCGEGPKHLPKADYQHGKAAFEMLERFEIASPSGVEASASFLLSAAEQMDAIPVNHNDAGMQAALLDYQDSIETAQSVRLSLHIAETTVEADKLDITNAKLEHKPAPNGVNVSALTENAFALRRALYEIAPIIRLCHDDAAQYFDVSAASTGNCKAQLSAFKMEYPSLR